MNNPYRLRYLPLFESDLQKAVDYISLQLHNPEAALRLAAETEQAILRRLVAPASFEPYRSSHERKHPYYRIRVRNYAVFYVIIGDIMEVRRFLYNKRDMAALL